MAYPHMLLPAYEGCGRPAALPGPSQQGKGSTAGFRTG